MKITIYGKDNCTYCTMAKNLAESKGAEVRYLSMGKDYTAQNFMAEFPGARTFPQVVFNGRKVGGYAALVELLTNEE
jgi:glutaredoxin